jgi:hypothetical protein
MSRRRIYRKYVLLLVALLTLAAPAPFTGTARANTCLRNGICYSVDYGQPSWTRCHVALPGTARVTLSGQPKVSGDYVATKYNVRIEGERQFELSVYQSRDCFMAHEGMRVSVQGCRYRPVWLESRCNRWDSFTIR